MSTPTPDEMKALIAEAREWVADGPFDTGARLIARLADALEGKSDE